MQGFLDVLVVAAGLFVVGQFAWAMRFHFTTDNMPLASKMISALGLFSVVLFIYLLVARIQPVAAHVVGLAIMIGASLLFVSAIRASREARLYYVFEGKRPERILTNGPYRYMRHPFYTSYLSLWFGWAFATWTLVAFVPVLIILVLYVRAAREEETLIAASPLGEDYAAYKRSAGFFWPRLRGSA